MENVLVTCGDEAFRIDTTMCQELYTDKDLENLFCMVRKCWNKFEEYRDVSIEDIDIDKLAEIYVSDENTCVVFRETFDELLDVFENNGKSTETFVKMLEVVGLNAENVKVVNLAAVS